MLRETAVFCLSAGQQRVRVALTRQPIEGVMSLAQVCLVLEEQRVPGDEGNDMLSMQGSAWTEDPRQVQSATLLPLGEWEEPLEEEEAHGEFVFDRGPTWEQRGRLLLPGGVSVVCNEGETSAAWLHGDGVVAAGRRYSSSGKLAGAWFSRRAAGHD